MGKLVLGKNDKENSVNGRRDEGNLNNNRR